MSERYTKLFTLPEQTVREDLHTPVGVAAGALLLDNQSGTALAQVKYTNISSKSIKTIKVNVSAYDVSGAKISGVDNYAYEGLIAAPGASFGDKTPIAMTDNNAHSFSVDVTSVEFSDGTSWSKFGEQAVKAAKEVGAQTVVVAKKAAKTTGKKILPFVVNLLVFLLLLSFAAVFVILLPEQHETEDIILGIGFILASIVSFPAFGSMLAKKEKGRLLRVLRWVVVVAIIALMSVLLNTI